MSATVVKQVQQPNQFELRGKFTRINYSTTSIAGIPQLSYQKLGTNLNFSGDEIRVVETEIGKLVTVTLEAVPDLQTVTLTLLIPTINLPEGDTEISIDTKAIITTGRTSIGGPNLVEGQLQTYRIFSLKGTASFVFF
ncbi:MAG: hypothetical protein ACRDEA_18020 [Microcystaceae cyanobacterium]